MRDVWVPPLPPQDVKEILELQATYQQRFAAKSMQHEEILATRSDRLSA